MKTTHLRLSVTALLVTASVGTAFAEPADVWSSGAPTVAAAAKAIAATPTPAPAPIVIAPSAAPAVVQPAVATAPATVMRSSYRYDSGSTAGSVLPNAASSAPTVAVDKTPVPQMSQRDLDEKLWLSALAGNLSMVMDLVNQGANPRITTRYGETAIHAAAARGHMQIIDFLVKRGVSINARTSNGWTALHHAVRFGHANVANYLIQAGANPRVQTSDAGQKTPIDIAMDKNDLRMARILGYQ
ncbi:ankyrin repeat domain-containing protein [uncultured Thiothrix sp.]|uniref:ankyrin repeat domain-containing protein n=1 Tax=uncultured Thiothrix sp. TaxID=223185 RepID=UPI00261617B1|nr:ankyrin repeat domain-containing protein [uncultured Thiothrix sp.]